MFERLLDMFINKDNLDKREKANLADDLEPAKPAEVDSSILKTIQDPIESPELKDNLHAAVEEAEEMHNEDSKKEEKEDNASEKLRDELFKNFKLKTK